MQKKKIKPLTNAEIAIFCNELSLLLNSGITPVDALSYMQEDSMTKEGILILKTLQEQLSEGQTLHDSLAQTGVFPIYMVEMIKLGEETGNLDTIMKKLAFYYEQQVSIHHAIKNAITYPIFMTILMITIILVLLIKILPILNQVFAQLGTELTGIAKNLLNLGAFLQNFSVLFILLLVICLLFFLFVTKTQKGNAMFSHFLQTSKLTRNFFLDMAYSRFAACFSLISSSGVNIFLGLDMIDRLIQNELMTEKIALCKKALANNEFIYDAFKQAHIFKASQLRMLQIAYKTGEADQELLAISNAYEEKVSERIQRILEIIEPTLVIIFSLIVGTILLSVILPLVGIMSSIGV